MTTLKKLALEPKILWAQILGLLGIWFGFPNDLFSCPLLILLWPLALVYLGISAKSKAEAARYGFIPSFLGSTLALYWLYLPIQNVGELPFIAAFGCALAVAACLALSQTIFTLLIFWAKHLPVILLATFGALSWANLELLTAVISGFPWLPISGALVVLPEFVQLAEFLGSIGVAGLWVLGAYLLFLPWFCKQERYLQFLGVALISSIVIYGNICLKNNPPESIPNGDDSFGVLFIEGNIDQNQKWQPVLQQKTISHYIKLSNEALKPFALEKPLVIWPETAMPFFFELKPSFAKQIRTWVQESQINLLFGAPGTDPNDPNHLIYNRATLLDQNGQTIGHYDKEHLVPFGEYTPSFLNFAFLEPLLQGVGIYSPGADQKPLHLDKLEMGMLICYEGIFPWLAQERVNAGANVLVDISNDSWFLKTPASRQHLYLTTLRAIEQKRWILRGTNSGISAVIDNFGRIVQKGQLFQEGSLYARAKINQSQTFFNQTAEIQVLSSLGIWLILGLYLAFKKRVDRPKT